MYYILKKSDRSLIRTSDAPFSTLTNETETEICLRGVEDNTLPSYNAATQKLVRITTDNDAAYTRTFSWSVVALSQTELDALTEKTQDTTRRNQAEAMLAALEGGTITVVQQRQILAFLLRRELRRSWS